MADTMDTYRTADPVSRRPRRRRRDAVPEHRLRRHREVRASAPTATSDARRAHVGDSLVMLGQANDQWKPLAAALYLWVPDVDATYARALAAGATSQIARPRTSPTATAMPASWMRTASPGGSRRP